LEVIRVVLDSKSFEKEKEKSKMRVCKSKWTLPEVTKNVRNVKMGR